MAIPLDFVGLNTLVREEIDTDTNTFGKNSVKGLKIEDGDGDSAGLLVTLENYPSFGGFSVSFWITVGSSSTQVYVDINDEDHFIFFDSSGNLKFAVGDGATNSRWNYWNISSETRESLNHYCISWSGDMTERAILYVNGNDQGSSTLVTGATTRSALGTIRIGDKASSSRAPEGPLLHLAFINKELTPSEVLELYSDGFINAVTNTSLVENILDYWKLGEELDTLTAGDSVPENTIIKPTIGNNSISVGMNVSIIEVLIPKETRNKLIATIPYANYLSALNIHRNGPYYYPTFKQLRTSENPITRYQNRNNIFSYMSLNSQERIVERGGKVVSSHVDKYGTITNYNETVVTSNNKPFEVFVNV